MLKLLKETTKWEDNTQNHVYIFEDSFTKIAGYIKQGTVEAIKFSKPIVFNKNGRTFESVKAKDFNLAVFKE